MTRLLLDTTFLIDVERLTAELDRSIADEDDVAIAAVTVAELRVGALSVDGRRRDARMHYVDHIVASVTIVDYDVSVAEAHAELLTVVRRQGRTRGAHDLIIAATAKATGRTVVSADVLAFTDLPGVDLRPH